MYEELLTRLTANGRSEFTAAEIQAEMNTMFEEEMHRMEQEYLKDHHEEPQPQQLQTAEQQEVYQTLSAFMKNSNGQGLELTEPDLLASFRQAKHDTGYFVEQPMSWEEAAGDIPEPSQPTPEYGVGIMKWKIMGIGTNSERMKAEIEELMKDSEQPQTRYEVVQPTSWEDITKDLGDIPQRDQNQDRDMER